MLGAICALVLLCSPAGAEEWQTESGPAPTTAGRAQLPPRGKILLGCRCDDINQVSRRTGQWHAISHGFWVLSGGAGKDFFDYEFRSHRQPLIHLAGARPGAVARGERDRTLMAMSAAANSYRGPAVWIRPMAEMNGHWNDYSAYNSNGSPRGRDNSTPMYRQAFRRMTLIFRGGSVTDINRRLRRLGMPALRSGGELPRSGRVLMVWNPQGTGSPDVPGNRPEAYYPGSAYVDVVANDLYEQGGRAYWRGMDELYRRYSSKPFLMAEWGPLHYDSPGFIRQMMAWARSHPRTVGLVYWGSFEGQPRSLQAYRSAVKSSAFVTGHAPPGWHTCLRGGDTGAVLWNAACSVYEPIADSIERRRSDSGGTYIANYTPRGVALKSRPTNPRRWYSRSEQTAWGYSTETERCHTTAPDGTWVGMYSASHASCEEQTAVALATIARRKPPGTWRCSGYEFATPDQEGTLRCSTSSGWGEITGRLVHPVALGRLAAAKVRGLSQECAKFWLWLDEDYSIQPLIHNATCEEITSLVREAAFGRAIAGLDGLQLVAPTPAGWDCAATAAGTRCFRSGGTSCVLLHALDDDARFQEVRVGRETVYAPKDSGVANPCALLGP